jgi:hypothetical protein
VQRAQGLEFVVLLEESRKLASGFFEPGVVLVILCVERFQVPAVGSELYINVRGDDLLFLCIKEENT